jgi:hypothetical protein
MIDHHFVTLLGPPKSGNSDASSPALAFIQKYVDQVDSMNLSGPFHDWYAPNAQFYNADGTQYSGGSTIWNWMRTLFGQFEKVEHDMKITRMFPLDIKDISGTKMAPVFITFDCVTTFWFGGALSGDGIAVPRMLSFLVAEAEEEGQGTDGLQILEGKAWWDSRVIAKEMARRENKLS